MHTSEKKVGIILILLLCFLSFYSSLFSQEKEKVKVYTVEVDKLNLRGGPGTRFKKITTLVKGDLLEEIDTSGAWIEVICIKGENKDKRGFVHEDYISKFFLEDIPRETKAENIQTPTQDSEDVSDYTYGTATLVDKNDLKIIKKIQEKMQKEALFFLSLLKQMEPKLENDSLSVKVVEKVKVIQFNAVVLDNFVSGSKVIHYPYINESFIVQEELDEFFHIVLQQGRTGFIHRQFVQYYTESSKRVVLTFQGVDENEVAGLLSQLNEIFLSISTNKKVADVIARKYNLTHSNLLEFIDYYQKINKYYKYAKKFYEEFDLSREFKYFGTKRSFLDKLTVWGQLMIGDESRKTEYVAANAQSEEVEGSNQDISLGASYNVNENLAATLSLNKQKEIMLQEFSTTNIFGDIKYKGVEDLDLLFLSGYNTYRSPDNENAEFNRITMGSNLGYRLSNTMNLSLDYDLNTYSYINDEQNNYSIHSIHGGINYRPKSDLLMDMKVLFESESGDLSNHQFTHIKPYLQLTSRRDRRYFKTRLGLDSYSFEDFTESNYQKIRGELNWGSNRSSYFLGGFYKNFPNKEIGSYWQARAQLSINSVDLKKRINLSLYNNFFPNNTSNNYTNLRFVFGTMTSSFNIVITAWHNPGDKDEEETVKPHIVDIYSKFDIMDIYYSMFGVHTKYLKIGPVIGMHANIIASEFEEKKWFERDGNLYRIGGFANLNYPVNDKIRIIGDGTFESGFVYTNNYTGFNDATGDIEIDADDPIFLRHPVTYQINFRLDYQLSLIINLVLRCGFYKVSTDFDEIPGSYPLESNSRFYIVGGINFRRN